MSSVNIDYEIGAGSGEVKYYEEISMGPKEPVNLANTIAGEIVNEILENALDIATIASGTGINWKEIKESRSNTHVTMNSPEIADGKDVKHRLDDQHLDNICSNIIGDIVEHIGINSPPQISEIIEGLNALSVNQNIQDKRDPLPLDVEMKKLLAEMLSPPYEIVNYDNIPVKGGVGDQPNEVSESILQEILVEPEIPKAIEKKSRVTDLVKNSPQIITEYLMMDELAKQNQDEWEERSEETLQVIELDYVKPGEELYRIQKSVLPECVALPDDDEDELIQMPQDIDVMDMVDLSSEAFREEERQLSSTNAVNTGAQGDERPSNKRVTLISTQEVTTNNGEIMDDSCSSSQMQFDITRSTINDEQRTKKKKWNFGARLWGFFRKGHRTHERASSSEKPK